MSIKIFFDGISSKYILTEKTNFDGFFCGKNSVKIFVPCYMCEGVQIFWEMILMEFVTILMDFHHNFCHDTNGQISKVSKIFPKFWCKFYFFLLQNVIVWNNALKKFIDMCTLILRCTNIILWLRLMRSEPFKHVKRSEPFKDAIRRHPKLKVLRRINTHYLTQT